MKRLKVFLGGLTAAVALSVIWAGLVNAHVFQTGANVKTDQGQKIDHTFFASGQTVNINSEVEGDVFCAGQTINITGKVHGDVICAGQTVNITGSVDGDVRIAGQTVIISSNVGGNATIAGQTFTLAPEASIEGDITLGSEKGVFNGTVGRDIAVGGSNVIIANKVGRDIKGNIENLELTTSARVTGNINFTSEKDIVKVGGAEVGGKVTRSDLSEEDKSNDGGMFAFGIGWFIYWFLATLLIAMVLALLFPRMLQTLSDRAFPTPWKALLTGFLASIAIPTILILIAITVVGLPLALVGGLLWLLIVLISGPLSGYYLGRLILRNSRRPLLIMLVGASILLVLYFIPFIGFLALLLALWTGSGMLLLELFRRTPRPAYNLASATTKQKKPKNNKR